MLIRTQLSLDYVANGVISYLSQTNPGYAYTAEPNPDYEKNNRARWEAYSIFSKKQGKGLLGILSRLTSSKEEVVSIARDRSWPAEVRITPKSGVSLDEAALKEFLAKYNKGY